MSITFQLDQHVAQNRTPRLVLLGRSIRHLHEHVYVPTATRRLATTWTKLDKNKRHYQQRKKKSACEAASRVALEYILSFCCHSRACRSPATQRPCFCECGPSSESHSFVHQLSNHFLFRLEPGCDKHPARPKTVSRPMAVLRQGHRRCRCVVPRERQTSQPVLQLARSWPNGALIWKNVSFCCPCCRVANNFFSVNGSARTHR